MSGKVGRVWASDLLNIGVMLTTISNTRRLAKLHNLQENTLIQQATLQGVIDMDLKIIEKVFSKSEAVRRERESFYIKKFQVVSKGINRKS